MEGAALNRLLALLASTWLLACGEGDAQTPTLPDAPAPSSTSKPADPPERYGSLAFTIETEGGRFRKFDYAITGPSFTKAGNVNVSKSRTVSALIPGIPVGSGYSVSLSGTSIAPANLRCSGSAPFSISAGNTTDVALSVACHFSDGPGEPEEPEEPEEPPSAPSAAPLPMWTPALLGFALLGLGAARTRRRLKGPKL